MKKITLIILLLILIPTIYAKEGSMKLLAVSENNNKSGSIANLHLEITEGDGRVFIDSFPLTKVDTQISTRFAKEIACHLSIVDCSNYNFFYNIRANSPIVGGPSAGAAISILTLSVLEDLNVNEKASITGTINSGGLIGPVGGIEGKINAAAKNNLTKVLIPKWSNINDTNLSELSNINGIEIIQVSDLKEAIFEMTGKKYENNKKIIVNSFYVDTMNDISSKLCEDTSKLVYDKNTSIIKDANELYDKGKKSIEINEFYSAASYCFGANVKFRYERYIDQNLNNQKIIRLVNDVFNRTKEFQDLIKSKKIETVTDLQTYMIVNQRLIEANEHLKNSIDDLKEDKLNSSIYSLSFGIERLNSAYSWANFFGKPGEKFVINDETLAKSCLNKISEVEERIEYLKLMTNLELNNRREEITRAYGQYNKNDFNSCLFTASQAKADIDIILNNLGITDANLEDVIIDRLNIVENILAESEEKGAFPILGYSYFEYAKSLKETDKFSTLLYLEYAVEFSNFDIYFEKNKFEFPKIDKKYLIMFFLGTIFGFFICFIWLKNEFITSKRKRHRKKF